MLGTNIGITQKKCRFPSDEAAEFEGDVVHDIEHALNTYALDTHTRWRHRLPPHIPAAACSSARHLRSLFCVFHMFVPSLSW
jgi:hypothetical protein